MPRDAKRYIVMCGSADLAETFVVIVTLFDVTAHVVEKGVGLFSPADVAPVNGILLYIAAARCRSSSHFAHCSCVSFANVLNRRANVL